MRIGVLAGEASGDILGARVLAALRQRHDIAPERIIVTAGGSAARLPSSARVVGRNDGAVLTGTR